MGSRYQNWYHNKCIAVCDLPPKIFCFVLFFLLKTLCHWMDSLETFQMMKSGIESPAHTEYNLVDVNLRRWINEIYLWSSELVSQFYNTNLPIQSLKTCLIQCSVFIFIPKYLSSELPNLHGVNLNLLCWHLRRLWLLMRSWNILTNSSPDVMTPPFIFLIIVCGGVT